MRVVVDNNIVVSAFLWGGIPRRVLNAARSRTIDIFTSPALIAELSRVLGTRAFRATPGFGSIVGSQNH